MRLRISFTYTSILLTLSACSNRHNSEEIIQAMQNYDRLIQKMDADSIATLYLENGELGTIAKGRDSIRRYLETFKEFHVISNTSISDSINIQGNNAVQHGVYNQQVILPSKDTAHVKGTFLTHWKYLPANGWRIQKMETFPSKD